MLLSQDQKAMIGEAIELAMFAVSAPVNMETLKKKVIQGLEHSFFTEESRRWINSTLLSAEEYVNYEVPYE